MRLGVAPREIRHGKVCASLIWVDAPGPTDADGAQVGASGARIRHALPKPLDPRTKVRWLPLLARSFDVQQPVEVIRAAGLAQGNDALPGLYPLQLGVEDAGCQ